MSDNTKSEVLRRIDLYIRERLLTRRKQSESQLFFLKERFKTGIIPLIELKVSIPLHSNQFYKFKTAENVFETEEDICKKYKCGSPKEGHSSYSRLNGLCMPIYKCEENDRCVGNVIVVKNDLKPPTDIYTMGHEDGHFIWNMGFSYVLYKEYNVPDLIRKDIRDTEDFAMFCGNIAMANSGYDLNSIITTSPDPSILEKEIRARDMVIELIPDQFYKRLFKGKMPRAR
jgi:hypothetical protein